MPSLRLSQLPAMLSSVPARLMVRRSRSLSPSARVFQSSVDPCQDTGERPLDTHRNAVVSTSRVSKWGVLDQRTAGVNSSVQYLHLATRWLSNLHNRRRTWAAVAGRGRHNSGDWEDSRAAGRPGSSAGLLSAAAVAFCLKKDSDNKGRQFGGLGSCYCLTYFYYK